MRGERKPSSRVQTTPRRIGRVHPDLIGRRIRKTGECKCFRSIGRTSCTIGLSVIALDRPTECISLRVIDRDAPGEAQRVISGAIGGGN